MEDTESKVEKRFEFKNEHEQPSSYAVSNRSGPLKTKIVGSSGLYEWRERNYTINEKDGDLNVREGENALQSLKLLSIKFVNALGSSINGTRFDLLFENGELQSFIALSNEDCEEWVKCLNTSIQNCKEKAISLPSSTSVTGEKEMLSRMSALSANDKSLSREIEDRATNFLASITTMTKRPSIHEMFPVSSSYKDINSHLNIDGGRNKEERQRGDRERGEKERERDGGGGDKERDKDGGDRVSERGGVDRERGGDRGERSTASNSYNKDRDRDRDKINLYDLKEVKTFDEIYRSKYDHSYGYDDEENNKSMMNNDNNNNLNLSTLNVSLNAVLENTIKEMEEATAKAVGSNKIQKKGKMFKNHLDISTSTVNLLKSKHQEQVSELRKHKIIKDKKKKKKENNLNSSQSKKPAIPFFLLQNKKVLKIQIPTAIGENNSQIFKNDRDKEKERHAVEKERYKETEKEKENVSPYWKTMQKSQLSKNNNNNNSEFEKISREVVLASPKRPKVVLIKRSPPPSNNNKTPTKKMKLKQDIPHFEVKNDVKKNTSKNAVLTSPEEASQHHIYNEKLDEDLKKMEQKISNEKLHFIQENLRKQYMDAEHNMRLSHQNDITNLKKNFELSLTHERIVNEKKIKELIQSHNDEDKVNETNLKRLKSLYEAQIEQLQRFVKEESERVKELREQLVTKNAEEISEKLNYHEKDESERLQNELNAVEASLLTCSDQLRVEKMTNLNNQNQMKALLEKASEYRNKHNKIESILEMREQQIKILEQENVLLEGERVRLLSLVEHQKNQLNRYASAIYGSNNGKRRKPK